MTDNEIMKALEMCIPIEHNCSLCPLSEEIYCCNHLLREVFDLYNRQKAEIERLQKIIVGFMDEVGTWSNKYDVDISNILKLPLLAKEDFNIKNKIKSEAKKEVADSLHSILDEHTLQNGDVHFVALYKAVEKLTKELTE